MSDCKTVRLGDVCEIVNGFAFDSKLFNTDKKGIPLIRIRDVIRGFSETYTTENADSRFLVKVGDLLIGMDGEFNCSLWKSEDSFLNQRVCKIVPNLKLINKDYVYYGLKGKLKEIEDKTSFVTVKHISSKQIENIVLKYPPLETQQQIVVQLDKCTALIAKQKQILEKYDTLIKSRFIEMFGNPTTNPMNWNTVNISSLLTANASNGFFAKRDEYTEDGNVEVLGVVNIVNTMYSKIDLLPKTNASEKDIKKYSVKYGDMLFCRSSLVAEGIGKASIVPENINKTILFECHVIRLRLDLNKCVPEYMQMLSTTSFFRNQVLKHAKTSTMTTIGQDGILKTDVRLPPIEKQKQFLSFIKQIDKSKFEYTYTGVAA